MRKLRTQWRFTSSTWGGDMVALVCQNVVLHNFDRSVRLTWAADCLFLSLMLFSTLKSTCVQMGSVLTPATFKTLDPITKCSCEGTIHSPSMNDVYESPAVYPFVFLTTPRIDDLNWSQTHANRQFRPHLGIIYLYLHNSILSSCDAMEADLNKDNSTWQKRLNRNTFHWEVVSWNHEEEMCLGLLQW